MYNLGGGCGVGVIVVVVCLGPVVVCFKSICSGSNVISTYSCMHTCMHTYGVKFDTHYNYST